MASVAQALIEGPAGEEKRQEQVEEKQDARVQLQVQGPVLEGQKSESIFVEVDGTSLSLFIRPCSNTVCRGYPWKADQGLQTQVH